MKRENNLVKHLDKTETIDNNKIFNNVNNNIINNINNVNNVCTDKTGTLTKNEMMFSMF
mgnify:CR=1 FL=1